ncbi:MAG: hypothetical protein AAF317_19275, partial [Pseudomonadota bacterium]
NPNRHNTVIEYYLENVLRALPGEGFDPASFEICGCEPTRLLSDGDTIELGDRTFEVLHLPGISEGTCGLFERETSVLFTGEALVWNGMNVYDGEPADRSADANPEAFCQSIGRLRELSASMVYPGHGGRQDPDRLRQVVASYLQRTSADTGI